MAKMIDNKPSWKGEGKVWESLSANLPGDNVVYNQREVNGREYDFCVMAENLGLVIIEVKGWDPDKIDVRGVDNIIVDGYDEPQTSPKKQARAYRFAILNKIVEKYNASPLVLDMVCYPFITQEQYVRTKLDIVSEPEYTIFKEDIEDGKKLNEKIQHLFTLNKFISHTDFSYDLMVRIRKQLEPDFKLSVIDNKNKPYSKLSIFPNGINENLIHAIIDDYFDGVKQIVFVSEQMEFDVFLRCLSDSFKLHNIDLKKNNLKVGYETGIKVSKYKDAFSTFNISVYCTPNLQKVIGEELVVVDGQCDEKQHELLATLSDMTSFNVQQYDIEHATTNRDILVEAGAGTGKTYSMVSRIAFLCNKQDEPVMNIADEVAMVTFTNDAAINMKKRLKQMFVNYFVLTGYERYLKYVEDIDRANISTIHKFAINILRGESLYTGLGTNFRISSNEYERGKAYDLFLNEYLEKKEEENANFSNELPIPVYDLKKKLMNVADRLFDKSINLETIKSSEMGTVVENNIPYFNDLLQEVMFPAEAIYTEMMRNSNDIDLRDCLIELDKILSNGCNKLEDLRIRYLPCLSVMCLQPEDTTIGRDRIKKRVLTPEKIIGRWDSLYNNAKSQRISNNRVFIDTSIKPNYADVDEFDDSPTSDADMNWNVYVLLFVDRAKRFFEEANKTQINVKECRLEGEKKLPTLAKAISDISSVLDEKNPLTILMAFAGDPISTIKPLLEFIDSLENEVQKAKNHIAIKKSGLMGFDGVEEAEHYVEEKKNIVEYKEKLERMVNA